MEDSEYQRRFLQRQLDRIKPGMGDYAWVLKLAVDIAIFSAVIYAILETRASPGLYCPGTQDLYNVVNWSSFNQTARNISSITSCICT